MQTLPLKEGCSKRTFCAVKERERRKAEMSAMGQGEERGSLWIFQKGRKMTGNRDIKTELAKKAGSIRNGSREEKAAYSASAEEMEGTAGMGRDNNNSEFVRLLRADEIECRVSVINEKGLSLLLFKDARVDQKILDETFTPFGWRRTHQSIDGNLYCTVEVWDEGKKQWIAKQDVGTVSYSEKEKGQASDSFKRACFNWGLGRELYSAPFIWIPAGTASIQKKGDRFVTSDRFSVQSISYNEQREIVSLVIVNGKGISVFEMGKRQWKGKEKEADTNIPQSAGVNAGTGIFVITEVHGWRWRRSLSARGFLWRRCLQDIISTAWMK